MRIGLFVTCLVDLHRPSVGFVAVKLLEDAGCEVVVPQQTCCGQPAFNNGDLDDARAIARQTIAAFEGLEHVVVPSGSCAGMLRLHYPELFEDDPVWDERAHDFAGRVHELTAFLVEVLGVSQTGATWNGRVTYHDSCSSLREMGVREQPRRLLAAVEGLELVEMQDTDVCCGFGGTFCVKYPEVSARMVSDKAKNAQATGAGLLLAGDLGCLLNIAGRLEREGSTMQVRHVAEVLAGMTDVPAIGESDRT
ncbi:MAG: (Fe-S)-binding protein [Chromatiales bacterium]|nr:(Fe-S)-binding protein [Chromatiales bacterium]